MHGGIAALAVILLVSGCVPSATPIRVAPAGEGCRVGQVIDGDTIDMICPGRGRERARLVGFDTPEVFSPRCGEERRLGQRATQRLRSLVGGGRNFDMQRRGHDDYGRVLVRLRIDGRDVGQTLVGEGLAVRYAGGPRIDWCRRLG